MLTSLISAIVSIVLILLLSNAQDTKPEKTKTGDLILQYPNGAKIFSCVISFILLGGFALIYFNVPVRTEEDNYATILMGVIAIMASVYFCVEFFTVKFVISNFGISITSGWRGYREYKWEEFSEVAYSITLMRFKLKSSSRSSLSVSGMLTGILLFQKYYMEYMPEKKWIAAYEKVKKDKRIPIS